MFGDKGCMLQSNFSESGKGLSTICGDVIEQQRSVLMFCLFYFNLSNVFVEYVVQYKNAALVHLSFE